MWISKRIFALFEEWKGMAAEATSNYNEQRCVNHELMGNVRRLEIENERLTRTLDWFKHRLTQVEQERAQLIYAATGGYGQVPTARDEGVKVSAPVFAQGPTMADTLNHQYNPFGTTGDDSLEPQDQIPGAVSEDLTHMPGFKG